MTLPHSTPPPKPVYYALVSRSEASPYRASLARFQRGATRFNEMMNMLVSMWDANQVPVASIARSSLQEGQPAGIDLEWEDFTTSQQREDLSLLGSEALHGLRTCLDLLVYESSERDSGGARSGTKFPVVKSLDVWNNRHTRSNLKWMTPQHREWLRAVQPFSGVTWADDLIRFSNADKHRSAVELSPTLRFRVDPAQGAVDPDDRSRLKLPVSEVQLHLMVTDGKKTVPVADVFPAMMTGVAGLLDKFRGEQGEPPLGFEVEIVNPWRRKEQ